MKKERVGRNDPCPCGSGKKFKRCCLQNQSIGLAEQSSARDFESMLRRGSQAIAKQQFTHALDLFKKALAIEPGSIIALAGAGHALLKSNRQIEAVHYLTQASARLLKRPFRGELVVPMLQLAQDLEAANRPRDALRLIQTVLRRLPQSAEAHHLSAICQLRLGQLEAASEASAKACKLAPDESNAIILRASIEARMGEFTSAKTRLVAIAHNSGDTNQARALLELARVEEKLENYDAALTAAEKSGEIMLASPEAGRLMKQSAIPAIKRIEQVATRDWLLSHQHEPAGAGRFVPVFLMGFYRSGTTLLEQILATQDRVFTSEEVDLIPYVLRKLDRMVPNDSYLIDKIDKLDSAQIAELRNCYYAYANETLQPPAGKDILLDKTTLNTLHLGLINVLFPDAKILFALRDPRDVCISCLMEPFALTPLTVNTLSLATTAAFYTDIVGHWLIMRDRLTIPWLEIRYEDVVEDMKPAIGPVFAYMGLEWTAEASEYYLHARNRNIATPSYSQVRQPLYRSSVGRWHNYESQMDNIAAVLNPFIKMFGYAAH